MEMPNTIPNALTQELLEDKYQIAEKTSLANYSFYMGTGNDNTDEVLRTNEKRKEVCGIKIFMGSSTGNMLVDNPNTLDRIFRESRLLIATHCEDEKIIRDNLQVLKATGKELTASDHPVIRRSRKNTGPGFISFISVQKRNCSFLPIWYHSRINELLQRFVCITCISPVMITTGLETGSNATRR
jgi:dihydroorotase